MCNVSDTSKAELFLFADDGWIGQTLRRLLETDCLTESSTYIGDGEVQQNNEMQPHAHRVVYSASFQRRRFHLDRNRLLTSRLWITWLHYLLQKQRETILQSEISD